MNRRTAWCLLVVLAAFLPGMGELVENGVHVVVEGHLAHADPVGDSHETPGPEHGCAGPFHSCTCCQSVPFALEARFTQLSVSQPSRRHACKRVQLPVDLFTSPIEHPPRA